MQNRPSSLYISNYPFFKSQVILYIFNRVSQIGTLSEKIKWLPERRFILSMETPISKLDPVQLVLSPAPTQ